MITATFKQYRISILPALESYTKQIKDSYNNKNNTDGNDEIR